MLGGGETAFRRRVEVANKTETPWGADGSYRLTLREKTGAVGETKFTLQIREKTADIASLVGPSLT